MLLNCPNTDTELPYIDLVIELLADKISPPIDAISTSYVQAALVNGTTYYYIVTAVNSVGEGAPSSQVSATPAAPTAVPPAPTGVSATPGRYPDHPFLDARFRSNQLQHLLVNNTRASPPPPGPR